MFVLKLGTRVAVQLQLHHHLPASAIMALMEQVLHLIALEVQRVVHGVIRAVQTVPYVMDDGVSRMMTLLLPYVENLVHGMSFLITPTKVLAFFY